MLKSGAYKTHDGRESQPQHIIALCWWATIIMTIINRVALAHTSDKAADAVKLFLLNRHLVVKQTQCRGVSLDPS